MHFHYTQNSNRVHIIIKKGNKCKTWFSPSFLVSASKNSWNKHISICSPNSGYPRTYMLVAWSCNEPLWGNILLGYFCYVVHLKIDFWLRTFFIKTAAYIWKRNSHNLHNDENRQTWVRTEDYCYHYASVLLLQWDI